MFRAMRKRKDIRQKRAFRKTTGESYPRVRLGVVCACVLIIAADLFFFGGMEILKFPFSDNDSSSQPSMALSVNDQIALAGMKGAGQERVGKNEWIIDETTNTTANAWEEIEFVSEIKVIEPYEIVPLDTEEAISDAIDFKAMSFGELGPVPIMPPMLFLGLGMAILMAIRSKIIY